jgi:hypothetical protein
VIGSNSLKIGLAKSSFKFMKKMEDVAHVSSESKYFQYMGDY